MAWLEKFAKAADAGEHVSHDEAVELTAQVATEMEDNDLVFGAEMVLQHYRHPEKLSVGSLVLATQKRLGWHE